jgi:hypothetical protein
MVNIHVLTLDSFTPLLFLHRILLELAIVNQSGY